MLSEEETAINLVKYFLIKHVVLVDFRKAFDVMLAVLMIMLN